MPILITGMHRSATSLAGRLLHELGIDFGPREELLPENEFNADGYWENRRLVELHDAILAALGGGWDAPPTRVPSWERRGEMEAFYGQAERVVSDLGLTEPWALKDPRVALILPFWKTLYPDAKVIICLRHPLEVALSLQRRGAMSPSLALSLWEAYNVPLLKLPPPDRAVVRYERVIESPEGQIRRLAASLALAPSDEDVARAADGVKVHLRHHRLDRRDLHLAGIPESVRALYLRLCDASEDRAVAPENSHRDPPDAASDPSPDGSAPLADTMRLLQERDRLVAETEGLRRDRDNWRRRSAALETDRDDSRGAHERLELEVKRLREEKERLAASARDAAELHAKLAASGEELARLTERVHELGESVERLASERDEAGRLADIGRDAATELVASRIGRDHLASENERLRDDVAAWREELRRSVADRDRWVKQAEARAAEITAAASTAAELRGQIERLLEERNRATEERDELRREAERLRELAAAAERVGAELDEARDGLRRSKDELEQWRQDAASLKTERDEWAAEAGRLQRAGQGSQAEVGRLQRDRDEWRGEAGRLQQDRDEWRAEAGRLTDDRNNWRAEAQNWRREAERLIAINERRLTQRAYRLAFRFARFAWWQLPRSVRDFLRPIIFRGARVVPAPQRKDEPERRRSAEAATPVAELPQEAGARDRALTILRASAVAAPPVSVLIPTLNAGAFFERVLESLSRQSGLTALELVVVDSGSTDGTPDRASAAGARVVRIRPDEFGHGRTRNQAAELASHDTFLMMVQDALLLGQTAVRDLALELQAEPRLAAVSARQLARSDSDLYGAYAVWSHDHVMRLVRRNLNGSRFEKLDPLERRGAAALDDVCAVVRRDAWAALRFRDVGFAEDLDFAVRAIRDGWTIGVSDDVAVAHSHVRDGVYHLRRSIADRLYVASIVGEPAPRALESRRATEVFAAGATLVEELAGAVSLVEDSGIRALDAHLTRLASILAAGAPRVAPGNELGQLHDFVREAGTDGVGQPDLSLTSEVTSLLRWPPLVQFARAQRAVDPRELNPFAAKLAASVIGRAVGDTIRLQGDWHEQSQLLAGV